MATQRIEQELFGLGNKSRHMGGISVKVEEDMVLWIEKWKRIEGREREHGFGMV